MLPHGYQHVAAYAELEKTNLEWTAFNIGWFLEYFGMPHVKTYIQQTTFVVDMAGKSASIPGDGKQKMTFTYSLDVAKFVIAALDLPKWDRDTIVIGDKMTWEEFVKLAEEARGMFAALLLSLLNCQMKRYANICQPQRRRKVHRHVRQRGEAEEWRNHRTARSGRCLLVFP